MNQSHVEKWHKKFDALVEEDYEYKLRDTGVQEKLKTLISQIIADTERVEKNTCGKCCEDCKQNMTTHPWGHWCHGEFHPHLKTPPPQETPITPKE